MTANAGGRPAGPKGQDELVFAALGGLGEIGMNVYLYGYGPPKRRRWLMVDLGITFPGDDQPGVDIVLPDLRYIIGEKNALDGIVLTHAHEDHIGAVAELWPSLGVPLYATPFTAGMVNSKSAEFGRRKLPMTIVPLGGRVSIGPFDVEFISLAHSIPEPSGLAIRTPAGLVVHTGDWKFDDQPFIGEKPDLAKLDALGKEGVLALVCDSTNAEREGRSPSETEIAASLGEIIKKAPKRVAVTTFASNVARLKAVSDAAQASGRKLVVAGRALHRIIDVAMSTGYLPEDFKYLDQQAFPDIPANEVLVMLTGSQGEARAALARVSDEEHPDVSLDRGDMVIFSSRTIPGNEKPVGKIHNKLIRLGCEVLTDNEALVHVTGHPRRGELKEMYQRLKPQISVPMHGEARHLAAHAKLALAEGVPKAYPMTSGELLKLGPHPSGIIDELPTGRLFRDGNLIVPDVEGPVRARRKLSFVGIVAASLVLSKRGEVLAEPELVLEGIPLAASNGDALTEIILDAIDGTLRSFPAAKRRDFEKVREAVTRSIRAAVNEVWGKKPIVKVLLSVVDGQN